ncbi:MAG TPA: DNA lyase [Methanobacteriales archaeon]|nr:DNA lyase [Methanobacteriaceae archaeon]MBC7096298.1 DNA lyase [Methanobacteriales archaeon]HIH61153.1 DNA lyase [Methanobacteriales archaeon]
MQGAFSIKAREFDLDATMYSGQTSQPPWHEKGKYYSELLMIDDKPALVTIKQTHDKLHVKVESPEKVHLSEVKERINYIFDLKFDIEAFYDFLYSYPPLDSIVDYSRGLRLFLAKDAFECIISSIASANCSIRRWTRAIGNMKRLWGQGYVFQRGTFYSFPSPDVLAVLDDDSLRAAGLGYRAKYIIGTSKKITRIKLDGMDYDEAFRLLLELPGVGPKVADCILLYGFRKLEAFPVDVWIQRIMEHLFKVDYKHLRDFARDEFGEYAGYVQLYLYNYARKSGILGGV